ncbi:nuclease-related domain-containing DEAD/DEAH box helicase [Coraliomargarita parva]|uniref:nuclease-related domain-containing DEAD/DEAH box helicase n=1 Tax=Coraliomargarita parva TaxID=3014050 RepID=UPI0022B3956C|nr:NERD domain-containing protein/DEAD/DEAH box helicase [Coraliomargarita parva]
MPIWFYNRPLDKADPTELRVAEVLNQLPEGWRIRWGYFYERKRHAGMRDREGDFILLGPDGRILVVEVKSGKNRHFPLTGEWEHGTDNPATQLFGEWKAVIDDLKANFDGTVPYVGKALCVPNVNLTGQDRLTGELGRENLIFGQDLDDFQGWWQQHMATHPTHCPDSVGAFHAALAKGLKPESLQMFLRQSDRLFEQFKSTEFGLLEMLQNNRHWMVEGGVGTGKTFLALKQAEWLAEGEGGRSVLFVVYNLLLAERLKRMAARLKLKRGSVTVLSWEELMGQIIATEGLPLEVPTASADLPRYFQEELPEYVAMALDSGKLALQYDALVVDEAQDHDTAGIEGAELGWWSWYLKLLKGGVEAPIAIYYDRAQRPAFRGADSFEPERLRTHLGGAVHLQLRKALRYTMPIYRYLKTLRAEATAPLVDAIEAHDGLPTGPEVVQRQTDPAGLVQAVESIVKGWKDTGLCKPSDVVLIGPRKWLKDSSLGAEATICGYEVADYDEEVRGKLNYIGAHRSKGMDFLAVILIDFAPFESLASSSKPDFAEAFFIGASRARQLLGVVSIQLSNG